MIKSINISLSEDLIDKIIFESSLTMKTTLNYPSDDFFYDPWFVKEEFKNTAVDQILKTLPFAIGEARIIVLNSEQCYTKHADIDDRYHLNLSGDEGYLIDLESKKMYHLVQDNTWYQMNAGILHTAASFGEHPRIQLVVRKLLIRNKLTCPVNVSILLQGNNPRYHFDNTLSPWLNYANKAGTITNFKVIDQGCNFDVDDISLKELLNLVPKQFQLTIN